MRLSELPAGPEFTDVPDRDHNHDNGKTRTLDVAWNLLLKKDLGEITFKEIARVAKITPSAIYYHYASIDDLAIELCWASIRRLNRELVAVHPKGTKPLHAFRVFLTFAKRRPHHFSLMISPRFNGNEDVAAFRDALNLNIDALLRKALAREPRSEERHQARLHLFGGGTLIVLGTASVDEVLNPLSKQLWNWRRGAKKRA